MLARRILHQKLYDCRAEKALSGNDVRHQFSWSSVYELPVGPGGRYLASGVSTRVLGDWHLGTIVTL